MISLSNRRHGLVGALVVLGVSIGIFVVFLTDWLNTLSNPFAR